MKKIYTIIMVAMMALPTFAQQITYGLSNKPVVMCKDVEIPKTYDTTEINSAGVTIPYGLKRNLTVANSFEKGCFLLKSGNQLVSSESS